MFSQLCWEQKELHMTHSLEHDPQNPQSHDILYHLPSSAAVVVYESISSIISTCSIGGNNELFVSTPSIDVAIGYGNTESMMDVLANLGINAENSLIAIALTLGTERKGKLLDTMLKSYPWDQFARILSPDGMVLVSGILNAEDVVRPRVVDRIEESGLQINTDAISTLKTVLSSQFGDALEPWQINPRNLFGSLYAMNERESRIGRPFFFIAQKPLFQSHVAHENGYNSGIETIAKGE